MQLNKTFSIIALSLFFLSHAYSAKFNAVIATSTKENLNHNFIQAVCDSFANNPKFNCTTRNSSGAYDNIKIMQRNQADIIITQSDTINSAYNKKNEFYGGVKFTTLRKILLVYPKTFNVIVSADDKEIDSMSDLKNKSVDIFGEGSGSMFTAKTSLELIKWSAKDLHNFNTSFDLDASFKKLCLGTISAVINVSGHINPILEKAFERCNLKFLDVSTAPFNVLTKQYPYYNKAVIPAYLYSNNRQSTVNSFATYAVFATTTNMRDEEVYAFLDGFFKNLAKIRDANPRILLNIVYDVKNIDEDRVPYHNGAIKYFKDNNWIK